MRIYELFQREYEIQSRELNSYKDKAALTLASFKVCKGKIR